MYTILFVFLGDWQQGCKERQRVRSTLLPVFWRSANERVLQTVLSCKVPVATTSSSKATVATKQTVSPAEQSRGHAASHAASNRRRETPHSGSSGKDINQK